jgi:hypothetical protein
MPDAGGSRKPIVLAPDEGRAYPMGRIRAVFKADRAETANGYSVSEWWLAGFTSFNSPGGFEARMEDIAPALAAEDLRI